MLFEAGDPLAQGTLYLKGVETLVDVGMNSAESFFHFPFQIVHPHFELAQFGREKTLAQFASFVDCAHIAFSIIPRAGEPPRS